MILATSGENHGPNHGRRSLNWILPPEIAHDKQQSQMPRTLATMILFDAGRNHGPKRKNNNRLNKHLWSQSHRELVDKTQFVHFGADSAYIRATQLKDTTQIGPVIQKCTWPKTITNFTRPNYDGFAPVASWIWWFQTNRAAFYYGA